MIEVVPFAEELGVIVRDRVDEAPISRSFRRDIPGIPGKELGERA